MAPPSVYVPLEKALTPFERWLVVMEGTEKGSAGQLTRLMFWLNAFGALGHLVGIVIELAVEIRFNMKLPLVQLNVTRNPVLNATNPFFYDYYQSGHLPIAWLLFSIHLQSLVFHAGYAVALGSGMRSNYQGLRLYYLNGIFRCRLFARWLEYFFSASTMILCLSALMGVRQIPTLVLQTGLCATTMLFGWICEVNSSNLIEEVPAEEVPPKAWWPFDGFVLTRRWKAGTSWDRRLWTHGVGYIPLGLMYYSVFDSFYMHRNAMGDEFPAFVDTTVWLTVLLFLLFGATQFLQQLFRYGPSWYHYAEGSYLVLSLAAKAQLVIIATFNALKPGSQFDGSLGAVFD